MNLQNQKPQPKRPAIEVGLSGWSYKDWEGCIYPRGTRDKLRYMAERFDVLEINSTYYRAPDPMMAASWLNRTIDLPHFRFTAKLHRDVTHHMHVDPELTLHYRRAFTPLIEEGRLSHFLAQFSASFKDGPGSRHHLQSVAHAYADLTQLTLELRHNSWQIPDAQAFIAGLGANVAQLDYPAGHDGFTANTRPVGRHAYLRLHGRNRKAWFRQGGQTGGRYDYNYQEQEIQQIVERARRLAQDNLSLTLVANNHAHGHAVTNALDIKARVSKP